MSNHPEERGYIKGIYGEIIEVIKKDSNWILLQPYVEGGDIIYTGGEIIYNTPSEAINGKHKKVKKISSKKHINMITTFAEKTSEKEENN